MSSNSWNWFFEEACAAWDASGDFGLAVAMLVDRLEGGIPRWVLEDEMRAYVHTAAHRHELDGMGDEEIIEHGLGRSN